MTNLRPIAAALTLLGLSAMTSLLQGREEHGIAAPPAYQDAGDAGAPLEHVYAGSDLSCQVAQRNAADHAMSPSGLTLGDCGTFLVVNNVLYAPDFFSHEGTATVQLGVYTPFTPVSQDPVTGSGSAADPRRVVTVAAAGATGVRIRQTDSYVIGETSYRTDVAIENTTASPVNVVLYRARNCHIGASNLGYGWADAASKAVGCASTPNNVPAHQFATWTSITPADRFMQAQTSQIWTTINAKADLPDTCVCTTSHENGAALSWRRTIPAGGSLTVSELATFSTYDALSVTKTADSASSDASATNGYTITLSNTNAFAVQVESIVDTLPAGFTYVPGTTSGVLTSNPSISGNVLTWWDGATVPAGSNVSLHFGVTVGSSAGTYFNSASATSPLVDVTGASNVASVSVSGAATPSPTSTSTATIVPPTSTATGTSTATATATSSATPVPATATSTPTSVPPTATNTPTSVPPTATNTATSVPPTATNTATSVPPTATSTPSQPGEPACLDLDGDGSVGMSDVGALVEHFGRKRFDARFDVNGDGRVNGLDMVLVVRQVGRRC